MFNYIYTFAYVILTSLSLTFIHQAGHFIPPSLTLFISTIIAILFFHLINFKEIKSIYQKTWSAKGLWISMMISVAVIWLATIYGPTLISPSLFILLGFSLSCLLGIFFNYLKEKKWYLLVSGLGILIFSSWITIDYLNHFISNHVFVGMGLGLLSGLFFFIYSKQSHQLSNTSQLTTTQILAVRFWLTLLLCALLLPTSPLHYLDIHSWMYILLICIVSLILPIFLLLKGILKIGAEKSSIICGLIPAITYVVQCLFTHQPHNIGILLLNLITGFFIAFPYFMQYREKKPL